MAGETVGMRRENNLYRVRWLRRLEEGTGIREHQVELVLPRNVIALRVSSLHMIGLHFPTLGNSDMATWFTLASEIWADVFCFSSRQKLEVSLPACHSLCLWPGNGECLMWWVLWQPGSLFIRKSRISPPTHKWGNTPPLFLKYWDLELLVYCHISYLDCYMEYWPLTFW